MAIIWCKNGMSVINLATARRPSEVSPQEMKGFWVPFYIFPLVSLTTVHLLATSMC